MAKRTRAGGQRVLEFGVARRDFQVAFQAGIIFFRIGFMGDAIITVRLSPGVASEDIGAILGGALLSIFFAVDQMAAGIAFPPDSKRYSCVREGENHSNQMVLAFPHLFGYR